MERELHEIVQGSDAWNQFRLDHFGASEAAIMLGLSKNVTRSELLRAKHTGIPKEFSDFVQERILDYGHAVEALARPLAEDLIAEELYPATYSMGTLSASCDGLTMDGETAFEHKQWATELAVSVARNELPEEHQPQCQQIMLVTGAKKTLFVVSDGTPEKFVSMIVMPDPDWQARIQAGWAQFALDLKNYQFVEAAPIAVAAPTMALPALSIQVTGSIALVDNLKVFGERLNAFIEGLDRNPSDDQAFADAEAAIKTLGTAETALEAAKSSALAQTASIDEMTRTVALYADQARSTRLMLTKLVTARKESIRVEIRQGGITALNEHLVGLNKRLGKAYMPTITADFAGAMKGKKTVASLRDAVDTELSRAKIAASAIADTIHINLTTLRELATDYAFLFADTAQIVLKAPDDLATLVHHRINEHRKAEQKRQDDERERIRQEEVAKLEAKAKADADELARKEAITRTTPAPLIAPAAPVPIAPGAAAGKPAVVLTPKGARPTDDAMIAVLALHYKVHDSKVIAWLLEMDLKSASERMAKVFS